MQPADKAVHQLRRRAALKRLLSCAPAVLAASGNWAASSGRETGWLPAPSLPDIGLQDHRGTTQRLVSDVIRDRVVLVHFYFTACASVCPPQTALLRALRERLDAMPSRRPPLFVGLSVDPLGDGPPQLRAHLERFALHAGVDAGWVWLTGAPRPLGLALQAFGVATAAPDAHPNLLWLGDAAQGRWTRTVALQSPEALARRIEELTA